jgi:hydrogenase large subunit
MPGGVTSDPVWRDIVEAKALLEEVDDFCKARLFGCFSGELIREEASLESIGPEALLGHVLAVLMRPDFAKLGKSHDRFLVLGINNGNAAKKSLTTRIVSAEPRHVQESTKGTFFEQNGHTYGKSALYKGRYYETGPIARMMIAKEPKIRDLHRKYKDALVTRVAARMLELAYLIAETQTLLETLDISEPSWIRPKILIETLDGVQGRGIIEASRGSLIHKIGLKKGKIAFYDIITPTVWNLGNGTQEAPSVIQKALFGVGSIKEADLIFKGLDVCSVCTTQ